MIHPSAIIDSPSTVGPGTRVWHFTHVMAGARIGRDCVLGQGVYVAGSAVIGNRVHIQNGVSVYDGVTLEDDVFVGPCAVFTNVRFPRAHRARKGAYEQTVVYTGASIGANATIRCGVTIGRYAMVGAGAVVTRNVAPHTLVTGVPAKPVGVVCRCGHPLPEAGIVATCPECGDRYDVSAYIPRRLAPGEPVEPQL